MWIFIIFAPEKLHLHVQLHYVKSRLHGQVSYNLFGVWLLKIEDCFKENNLLYYVKLNLWNKLHTPLIRNETKPLKQPTFLCVKPVNDYFFGIYILSQYKMLLTPNNEEYMWPNASKWGTFRARSNFRYCFYLIVDTIRNILAPRCSQVTDISSEQNMTNVNQMFWVTANWKSQFPDKSLRNPPK